MEKKKKFILYLVAILVVVVILGSSYAFWVITVEQKNENLVNSQCFKLSFLESTNAISLLEGYPMSDEDGSSLTPYTFQIKNECSAKAKYTLRLEIDDTTTMNEKYLKSRLNTKSIRKISELEETEPTLENAKKSYKLGEFIINGNSEEEYELRIWIDGGVTSDNLEVMNRVFSARVSVEGDYEGTYTESILNGTDPVLSKGLIPVVISDNGEVRKADVNSEWYKYSDRQWANAVILNDESVRYRDNEVIPESNIESYFVWIPRYRYQIFDNGMYYELSDTVENKAQEIKIVFENKETQLSKGSKKGDWLTHPAFTSFDTNGIWVGKFETGYKGSADTVSSESNTNEPEKVQIKPNVNSWRKIQIANAFFTSYDYKRSFDSHMMKNTEWGAVAYLQHSKYGSQTSVRINNHSGYMTGYASVKEPTCGYTGKNDTCNQYGTESSVTQPWNTTIGYLASTTGNISGIYDMSGGAHEYVMGIMTDKNGNPMSGRNSKYNSGFNGTFGCPTCDNDTSGLTSLTTGKNFPKSEYYDIYSYIGQEIDRYNVYQYRILGDATGEMGPFSTATYGSQTRQISSWYQNEAKFIAYDLSWFIRGGHFNNGSDANILGYSNHYGHAYMPVSYRIVLTM
jgi:hypothetical protein